jgi:ribose transport system substrate-binding protein
MRVILSLPDEENAYQKMQAAEARTTARRLRQELELLDCKGNSIEQVQALAKAIHADPPAKAVLVEPLSTHMFGSISSLIESTAPKGVGWFILNADNLSIETLRSAHPKIALTSVCSDQVEIGRVQGRQIQRLLRPGAHVLCVNGRQASAVVEERERGLKEMLGTAYRVTTVDAQWTEESACLAVTRWLQLKLWERTPIDAIAAQDDVMAKGARDALRALPGNPMARVKVLGIDGVPEYGQRLVRERVLDATVIQRSNAGPALEGVAQWLSRGERPPARVLLPIESYPELNRLSA